MEITVSNFGANLTVEITQAQVVEMVQFLQTVCFETCLLTDQQNPCQEDLVQDLQQLIITKEDASKLLAKIHPVLGPAEE